MSRVRQRVIQILSGYQPAADGELLPNQSLADSPAARRAVPRCGICRATLTESLAYQIVSVRGPADGHLRTDAADDDDGDDPVVQVALVYCTSCGVALCSMTLGGREPPVGPPMPG